MFEGVKILENLTWGIAGRNKEKLESVLKEVGEKVKKNLSATPIIIADVSDEESLKGMAAKAKVSQRPQSIYVDILEINCLLRLHTGGERVCVCVRLCVVCMQCRPWRNFQRIKIDIIAICVD